MSTYPRRPKAEAFDNAVDVVKLLLVLTDQAQNVCTSEFLAHVQLDDNPRAPIQQSVGEEFRQHDGVVMVMVM